MSTRLPRRGALLRPLALPLLFVSAALVLVACSGNDSTNGASGFGSSATSSGSPATSTTPAAAISAATPVPTATTTPAPTSTGTPTSPTATPTPAPGALTDLAPCSSQTYFTKIKSSNGVPTIAYKGVSHGTPILFPFETGSVKHVDSGANGISVTFDVPGVGVLIVGTADMNGLERAYGQVARGQVIGHFGGVYPDEANQPLSGYQAYAQVLEQDPAATSIQVTGQALDPQVNGCISP